MGWLLFFVVFGSEVDAASEEVDAGMRVVDPSGDIYLSIYSFLFQFE
jgi:hypothetical protein